MTRDGGAVILVAACPEGAGSRRYEDWMAGVTSHQQVLERFAREPFRVGPHKAFLLSRDAARMRTVLVSEMAPELVQRFLLTPATNLDMALERVLPGLPEHARVGILPRASATIPLVD